MRTAAAQAFQSLADAVDAADCRDEGANASPSPQQLAETAQREFKSVLVMLSKALGTSTEAEELAQIVRIIAECRSLFDKMFEDIDK